MDNGENCWLRFLDGDESAFVEIVRDYKDGLILFINGFTKNIHTAEELAEDTFVKMGVKRPVSSGKASFKTWLYSIARNLAIDYLRKNSKKPAVSAEDYTEILKDETDLEREYIKEESRMALHKAMGGLKPDYRQILWLIYFEDFTYKEAAAVMKKSVHGAEMLASRARRALKEQLEKEGFDHDEEL